jgi:undecaprenyl diphosphate synthase
MPDRELDKDRLPRHLAIIMDGNGRWAQQHGVSRTAGHEAGAASVRAVVEACRELGGIDVVTLYAFSTENWRRPVLEVTGLFQLLRKYIQAELDNIHRENIRVTAMGRLEGLAPGVVEDVRRSIEQTANNTAMTLNIALNYGGRAEIVDAARGLAADVQQGRVAVDSIDEATFANYLYQPGLPELELLIRTSGEMRISNFMLWQVSYTEIVVTPVLWPEFRKEHLHDALREFQRRSRRFGGQ